MEGMPFRLYVLLLNVKQLNILLVLYICISKNLIAIFFKSFDVIDTIQIEKNSQI